MAPPVVAAPVGDDTPVLLHPKGEREDGSDENGSFDKLRDAYYWSRLLAGDDELTLEQAAGLRSKASGDANTLEAETQRGVARGGTWVNTGPDPIVQVGRTSNTFQAVSGRIGALAIRNDGTIVLGAAQGGIWTYDSASGTWTSRTADTSTQSVGALAIAPSNDKIIYAGSGEGALSGDSYYGDGVYKSTDGGVTWARVSGDLFNGQASAAIEVDPANPDHVYLATVRGRGGARRTTHPATAQFGVWESRDGGRNWKLDKGTTDELHGATDLVMDPRNPRNLWASFWGDAIYRSTDGGATWTNALGNLPPGNFLEGGTRFALGLSHPNGAASPTIYTNYDYFDLTDAYHASRVWKTTDGGTTWTLTGAGTGADAVAGSCGTQCFYDNFVRPDPTDPNTVYVGGSYGYNNSPQSGGVYRSTDGGATWKSLGYDLHPDFHAFAFQPNNTQHIAIGNDGGIWQSATGGGRKGAADPLSAAQWENLNGTVDAATGALVHSSGLRITQFTSMATVPQVPGQYWGGTQDNGTLRKSLANTRWFDQAGGDGGQVLVDQTTTNPLNPNLPAYVFGTFFGISPYRYDPSEVGTFFGNEPIDGGINLQDRAEFYVPWVQNRSNPNQIFLGTYRLYRTNNAEAPSAGDVHFDTISPDLSTGCPGAAPNGARGCFISAIGLAEGGDGVYVGTDDGVVSVSPNAVTSNTPSWTRVGQNVLPNRPITQFAVDRSNWRVAYASYAGFGAATPRNRGHVFKTTDGGRHWQDISGRLPDVPVNSIILDPSDDNTLYIGTDVGPFSTRNGGQTWKRLGNGMPKVSTWQLDYDPSHAVLAAGTHGRAAYTLDTGVSTPALVVSTSDSGLPVGPGSLVNYKVTVSNIGNAAATGVRLDVPLPDRTSFVSAANGGTFRDNTIRWRGLSVPAGGSTSVSFTVRISNRLPSTVTSIVNDGITVKSDQGVDASSSPHTVPIAPAHSVVVSADEQKGGARVGSDASFTVHVTNKGFQPDSYALSTTGAWTANTFDATCTTPSPTTPTVAPGSSVDVCVKVSVPANAANDSTSDTTLTAKSNGDNTVTGSVTLTTIAVSTDTLVVDEDLGAPNVQQFYLDALAANGTATGYWDLSADPVLPRSYVTAHRNVVWLTGNTYPGPITPYEGVLKAFLDGGGRLFMSGQDILDQAAGTTAFVRDYLHISWDGTERQNDKPTAAVHGVAGSAVSDGIGAVPIDHSVLGATFEDQVTPIAPAQSAFTDDTGAIDGQTVTAGSYKVVFLAFPFEAYGSAAQKADLMHRVLTYFG
ncbi:FixG Ig-like domain-containing protein [Actinocrispum sp. NPDC049592]|uniref:FixG Ig-like domain-containing protein n=1 Tax=Actinocrispum sp. NPDC049592 TaxID=3154835 RepID=UPI00342DC5D8